MCYNALNTSKANTTQIILGWSRHQDSQDLQWRKFTRFVWLQRSTVGNKEWWARNQYHFGIALEKYVLPFDGEDNVQWSHSNFKDCHVALWLHSVPSTTTTKMLIFVTFLLLHRHQVNIRSISSHSQIESMFKKLASSTMLLLFISVDHYMCSHL